MLTINSYVDMAQTISALSTLIYLIYTIKCKKHQSSSSKVSISAYALIRFRGNHCFSSSFSVSIE